MSQPLGPRQGHPQVDPFVQPRPEAGRETSHKRAQDGAGPSQRQVHPEPGPPARPKVSAQSAAVGTTRGPASQVAPLTSVLLGPSRSRAGQRSRFDASNYEQAPTATAAAIAPRFDNALSVGMQVPSAETSATAPRAAQGPLPRLPQNVRGRTKAAANKNAFEAFFEQLLGSEEARRSEAQSHGARPNAMPAWRRPDVLATMTLPLPSSYAHKTVTVRMRPVPAQAPAKSVTIAVVARPKTGAMVLREADVRGRSAEHANVQGEAPGPRTAAPSKEPITLGSLAAPRSPTALVLGLDTPRGARNLLPKDRAAQQMAQQRARTKQRFAAFAKLQASRTDDADDEGLRARRDGEQTSES